MYVLVGRAEIYQIREHSVSRSLILAVWSQRHPPENQSLVRIVTLPPYKLLLPEVSKITLGNKN